MKNILKRGESFVMYELRKTPRFCKRRVLNFTIFLTKYLVKNQNNSGKATQTLQWAKPTPLKAKLLCHVFLVSVPAGFVRANIIGILLRKMLPQRRM